MTAHDDNAARDLDLGPEPVGEDVRHVAHLLLVDAATIEEMPGAQARRRLLLEQIAQEPREAGAVAVVGAGAEGRGSAGDGRLRHLWRAHRVLVVAAVLVVACTSLAFADTRTPVGSVIRHAARTVHLPVPDEPPAGRPAPPRGGAAGVNGTSAGTGDGGGARGTGDRPDAGGEPGAERGAGRSAGGATGAGGTRPGAERDAYGLDGEPMPGDDGFEGEIGLEPGGGSGQPVDGAPRPQRPAYGDGSGGQVPQQPQPGGQQPATGGGGQPAPQQPQPPVNPRPPQGGAPGGGGGGSSPNPNPNPGVPQGQQPPPGGGTGSSGGGQQPVNPPPNGGGGGPSTGGNRPPQGGGGGNGANATPVPTPN